MACNVYLTFFHRYNSEQLRQLEWKYVLCCYGLPFIPAFAYFFIKTESRGRVYGSAIVGFRNDLISIYGLLTPFKLWCWVAVPWDFLRIAVFYGPVWFVISLTFAIYLRAGSLIYQKRRQLRELGGIDSIDSDTHPVMKLAGIQVTSEIACSSPVRHSISSTEIQTMRSFTATSFCPYSVTIEGGPLDPIRGLQRGGTMPLHGPAFSSRPGSSTLRPEVSSANARFEVVDSFTAQRRAVATDVNLAACAYTKYAVMFFIALLVTWV
ncbi:hypothetical protein N7523_009004 [Penicillium sp. IBT 18751x]|nr:hypothetical protein N7523_009004 [Penicillium sp. IBT 18751x]